MKVMLNIKTGVQHIVGGCRWVNNCMTKTHKPIPASTFVTADYDPDKPACTRNGCLAERLP